MIRLTEIASLFRVEELYIFVNDGFVEVDSQVPSNSFTYQIVEEFLKEIKDRKNLHFNHTVFKSYSYNYKELEGQGPNLVIFLCCNNVNEGPDE
jgi:hypothetical protein